MLTWSYAMAHYTLMWPMLGLLTWTATFIGLVTASFLWLLIECIGFKPFPRHMCGDCGYQLVPGQHTRCPECGSEVDGESSRRRPRRRNRIRIGLSFIALVLSMGGPIAYAPQSALPYVPFAILVRYAPLESVFRLSTVSVLDQEVLRRATSGDFSLESNVRYVREQLKRLEQRGRLVHHRNAWPDGEAMVVRFFNPVDDLVTEYTLWIRVYAGPDNTHLASFVSLYRAHMARVPHPSNVGWEMDLVELPDHVIQDGLVELQFYGEYVEDSKAQDGFSKAPFLLHRVEIPARRVNDVDDAIEPVRCADMASDLRAALYVDCRHDTQTYIRVAVDDVEPLAQYADVAFGFDCEVVEDGSVIRRRKLLLDVENDTDANSWGYPAAGKLLFKNLFSGHGGRKVGAYGIDIDINPLDSDANANGETTARDLELRLIGNGRLGLNQLEKRRYWDGVLVFPLRCE